MNWNRQSVVGCTGVGPRRCHGPLHCESTIHHDAQVTTEAIRDEFVRARIGGKSISLKELAARHGRSHDALRQAASKGQWTKLATLACAERGAAVAEKITQQNALTACVLEQAVEHEVQVRERHARLARSLQQVAVERLMTLTAGELSAKLAIELLKTGIDVERAALGLADMRSPAEHNDGEDRSVLQEAVREAQDILLRHARSRDLE